MKKVSILIPCFNEEDNVSQIALAVCSQMEKLQQYDYDLVFIDNNSTDKTRTIIKELCSNNKKIKAIFNAKNYGQFSSPYYGILQCSGDCVILMACDFQDPVDLIPKYLEAWEDGYKIVLGQKTSSKENRLIYHSRTFYYRFMKKHSGIEFLEHVTGSGLYDRSFINVMKQIDDSRPFLRGIVAEMGFNIKLIQFEQPRREKGKSSNNLYTYMDGAAQSLTAYTKFGCRLALHVGLFTTVLSLIAFVSLIIYKCLNWDTFTLEDYFLDSIIILLVSLNIFFVGVVGEYVMDANIHTRKKPIVVESERINFNEPPIKKEI